MGCCLSCSCRCTSSNTFNTIRLVHLDGYVENFDHPISVSEVTGKPPKQFLCTAAQLLSAGSMPLNPDTQLQPGHIYFVLPLSTLQNEISPLDMASIAKRLASRAKSIKSDHVSPKTSPSWSQNGFSSIGDSAVRSPGWPERKEMACVLHRSCRTRTRSWKPILETIREISFTGRNESDLQEMHLLAGK